MKTQTLLTPFFTLLTGTSLFLVSCEQPSTEADSQAPQVQSEVVEAVQPETANTTALAPPALREPRVSNSKRDSFSSLKDTKGSNQAAGFTKGDKKGNADPTVDLAEQVVTATPTKLDLGSFSTSEKGTGTVTLTNTGDDPITIERSKASCGCTTSDFQPGTVLQPGETTDVSVTMSGKGRARTMSKTVTFTITGYPPLRLPVVAETISYVSLDKNPIEITDDEGFTTITLTSIDETPFVVTSMIPAIAELSDEPAVTQELKLDWNQFWELVESTKLTLRLNHPLCNEITTTVRLSADQRQRLNQIISKRRSGGDTLSVKAPTQPLNGEQLARYIKAGRGEQVIKLINDGLGKYDAVDRGGVSLLSISAEEGDDRTVASLLKLGAELEQVDRVNRTPLMYAARSKSPETIQVLLTAGADMQARDRLGNTPLSWASGFGSSGGVQVLIDEGSDANTVDMVLGYTPLIWASGFGEADSVKILLSAGADVNVYDTAEGRTPLMHAVRTGNVEGVAYLLTAGANVNGIDNTKSTALHIGANGNNVTLDKIKLLVEAGADVNAKNAEGKTALELAQYRGDSDGIVIVEYLSTKTDSK